MTGREDLGGIVCWSCDGREDLDGIVCWSCDGRGDLGGIVRWSCDGREIWMAKFGHTEIIDLK